MKKLFQIFVFLMFSMSCHAGFLTGLATGVPDGSLGGFIGAQEHQSAPSYYVEENRKTPEEEAAEKKLTYWIVGGMFSALPLTLLAIYMINLPRFQKKLA